MKTKLTILLLIINIHTHAGDTIFRARPGTRYWNPAYLQEVFIDNFNGNSMNTNIWHVELYKGRGNGSYGDNNEGEPDNIQVSNGTLKLTTRHEPRNVDINCWDSPHFVTDYTASEIWSG